MHLFVMRLFVSKNIIKIEKEILCNNCATQSEMKSLHVIFLIPFHHKHWICYFCFEWICFKSNSKIFLKAHVNKTKGFSGAFEIK